MVFHSRMLKSMLGAVLLTVIFGHVAFAQSSLVSKAKLQSVDIYNRGATLHHTVQKVSVPQGNSSLVIAQLAKQVNTSSIRVKTSQPNVVVESISFEKSYLSDEKSGSPQYRELKAQMEKENRKWEELKNERKGEEGVLSLLDENKKIGGNTGASPTKISEMINYYRSEYKKISANVDALRKVEEKQAEKVKSIEKQLGQLGSEESETGQLFLKVYAPQAAEVDFEVFYFTNLVHWNPFYELRAQSLDQPLQLSYKANVSQQTGIDWEQVQLKFSSTQPNQNNNAPVLNPWRLRYREMQLAEAAPRMVGKAAVSLKAYSNADNQVVEEVAMADAAVVENQLSNSFLVSKPYNIYTGSQPQAVELKEYQLPAAYTYYTAPKYDATAYLIAKITDWEQYNLLPGNANLLIDNNYAGTSYINPNTTQDTLTLSLGRDDRIQINRKMIEEEGSATKFLGKTKKREYTYEITVRNTTNEFIALEVVDQYPISNEKDMEIQLLETSGAVIDKKEGRLTWNLNLAGKETKVLKLSYSVSYPKEQIVDGL